MLQIQLALGAWHLGCCARCDKQRFTSASDQRYAMQGLICFESIMQDAAARGISSGGAPVICKPSRKVSVMTLTRAPMSGRASTCHMGLTRCCAVRLISVCNLSRLSMQRRANAKTAVQIALTGQ